MGTLHKPPEWRTATAAGLANDDARARAGRGRPTAQLPRPVHALAEEGARLVPCGVCWQQPGKPCTRYFPPGDHLARYLRAERRGLISRTDLARVVAGLDVVAAHVIIPDVTS